MGSDRQPRYLTDLQPYSIVAETCINRCHNKLIVPTIPPTNTERVREYIGKKYAPIDEQINYVVAEKAMRLTPIFPRGVGKGTKSLHFAEVKFHVTSSKPVALFVL